MDEVIELDWNWDIFPVNIPLIWICFAKFVFYDEKIVFIHSIEIEIEKNEPNYWNNNPYINSSSLIYVVTFGFKSSEFSVLTRETFAKIRFLCNGVVSHSLNIDFLVKGYKTDEQKTIRKKGYNVKD